MDTGPWWSAPILHGARVKTDVLPECSKNYVSTANARRKSHVKGTVVDYSNSHGICYTVIHDDGTWAVYDPEELMIV